MEYNSSNFYYSIDNNTADTLAMNTINVDNNIINTIPSYTDTSSSSSSSNNNNNNNNTLYIPTFTQSPTLTTTPIDYNNNNNNTPYITSASPVCYPASLENSANIPVVTTTTTASPFYTMTQPISTPSPAIATTTTSSTTTATSTMYTAEGIYEYMVCLQHSDSQTFCQLMDALNNISAPTQFNFVENTNNNSTEYSNEFSNWNSGNSETVENSCIIANSPTVAMTSCKCSGGSGGVTHSDVKKRSNPSLILPHKGKVDRSKIAKKFYAEGNGEEYYECSVCKERRVSNTFASEGHNHEGEHFKVRWFCPMCNKSTAVTYRTSHLQTKHGIKKLSKQ